ncbi:type II toxin-antitoxin system VapC family toxin [Methylomonas montana]|uniref:type II toxin-antitoxin system VapC family toxin n=1 Tax=Methylomonas montana TaxID=3058963 RepID=UPI00265927F2|nr:type II toxin-antitoxin system VapC family toxin [Methylomonas montana]WKJ92111.1 type II toxin-antitoxin system VapC family toxin [Methylomonas montana]
MLTICDTNVLLFWADNRDRLTVAAQQALDQGRERGTLACAAISFWEIAMLFRKNRLALPAHHTPTSYMDDIVESLGLNILQLTPSIAALAESGIVTHGNPGDRLIAATAIAHQAPLITADEKLRANPGLQCIW